MKKRKEVEIEVVFCAYEKQVNTSKSTLKKSIEFVSCSPK